MTWFKKAPVEVSEPDLLSHWEDKRNLISNAYKEFAEAAAVGQSVAVLFQYSEVCGVFVVQATDVKNVGHVQGSPGLWVDMQSGGSIFFRGEEVLAWFAPDLSGKD